MGSNGEIGVHKDGKAVVAYSKSGADFTKRYEAVVQAARELPVKSGIIDAEITVLDDRGRPDFRALHSRKFDQARLCLWGFDLLECDGKDLRMLPLIARRMKLGTILGSSPTRSYGTRRRSQTPTSCSHCAPPRVGRHRVKAEGWAVSLGQQERVDQDQVCGVAGSKPRALQAVREVEKPIGSGVEEKETPSLGGGWAFNRGRQPVGGTSCHRRGRVQACLVAWTSVQPPPGLPVPLS